MYIDTIKTYCCDKCEIGLDISSCEYDEYEGEYICPYCRERSVIISRERQPEWFSVAIYEVSRAYGGAEEGGWYYDEGSRINETVRTFRNTPEGLEEADKYIDALHATQFPMRATRYGDVSHSSRTASEDLPATHFPQRRPHYS